MDAKQLAMLMTTWALTMGESGIYGNAIGCPTGEPNATAQALIDADLLTYDVGTKRFRITEEGAQVLRDEGMIE